jgi:hypothetical protein
MKVSVSISELRKHPEQFHSLIPKGAIDGSGSSLIIEQDLLTAGIPFESIKEPIVEQPRTIAFPTLMEQAANFTKAAGRVVDNAIHFKPFIASEEVKKERTAICNACEFLVNKRCSKCGCGYQSKISFITEQCPIGKWGKVDKT